MTETTLKIRLSELTTVRVVCCKSEGGGVCGGIVEVPVDKLRQLAKPNSAKCPICHKPMIGDDTLTDPFGDMAMLLERLKEFKARFALEFPIRLDADDQG
jgi:hypothetical protein